MDMTDTSSPIDISPGLRPAFQAWCCSSYGLVYLTRKKKGRFLRAGECWDSWSASFSWKIMREKRKIRAVSQCTQSSGSSVTGKVKSYPQPHGGGLGAG